jgi:hypothetical protein
VVGDEAQSTGTALMHVALLGRPPEAIQPGMPCCYYETSSDPSPDDEEGVQRHLCTPYEYAAKYSVLCSVQTKYILVWTRSSVFLSN